MHSLSDIISRAAKSAAKVDRIASDIVIRARAKRTRRSALRVAQNRVNIPVKITKPRKSRKTTSAE